MLKYSDKYSLKDLSKNELIERYVRLKEEANKNIINSLLTSIETERTIKKVIETELTKALNL